MVEDIFLNNGTMATICKEHVELKFGDNAVDVSRRCARPRWRETNAMLTLLHTVSDQAFFDIAFLFSSASCTSRPFHSIRHQEQKLVLAGSDRIRYGQAAHWLSPRVPNIACTGRRATKPPNSDAENTRSPKQPTTTVWNA